MSNPANLVEPATVVIRHRVKKGMHAEYEAWLVRIGAACRASIGHLDWQIIRPIQNLSVHYTVIVRFDSVEHLRQWMDSARRQDLVVEAAKILAADDEYTIHSGLDFWFTPKSEGVKVPVRWKQFFVTWSAIYPLALLVPMGVLPLIGLLGQGQNRLLATLVTTGVIVALMVYVVMPRYTYFVRRWLYS